LVEHRFTPADARRFRGLLPFPFRPGIRFRESGDGLMELPPLVGSEPIEQSPVGSDPV
jgi:hypothetical protein